MVGREGQPPQPVAAESGRPAPPGALRGHWSTLEPITQANVAEVRALDEGRRQTPGMGGYYQLPAVAGRYGPAMALRDNRTGTVFGVVENDEMRGYPGVAVFIVYVDQTLARPGYAMEAAGIYIPTLYANGASIVHVEVLSFNRLLTHMFAHRGHPPDVRMRRHAYVGGHYWDLLVYAFDREQWQETFGKFDAVLPGGSRRLAALGS